MLAYYRFNTFNGLECLLRAKRKPLTLGAIRTRLLWRASSELMREAARGSGTLTEGCSTSDWFTGNWMGTRYELTRGSSGFIFRPRRTRERSGAGVQEYRPSQSRELTLLLWTQRPLSLATDSRSLVVFKIRPQSKD